MTSLAFSSDNILLMAGSEDGPIEVFHDKPKGSFASVHSIFPQNALEESDRTKDLTVKCLAFSTDNKYCVAVQSGGTISIWSKKGLGYPYLQIRQSNLGVKRLLVAIFLETPSDLNGNERRELLLVSADRTIIILDLLGVVSGFDKVRTNISYKHILRSPVHSLAVSPRGERIASFSQEGFFDISIEQPRP